MYRKVGNVNEFKKFLFSAAAKAGYGKIKEVVLVGDGAQWIWNLCEELFTDAVQILDYYHLTENVNNYANIYTQMMKLHVRFGQTRYRMR